MNSGPITCLIRYKIADGKQSEFEHYARVWKRIIERLGGNYLGCLLPGNEPPDALHFSFPAIAKKGPVDMALVIFSFRDLAGYEHYRSEAASDPECQMITEFHNKSKCFISYERTFVRWVDL